MGYLKNIWNALLGKFKNTESSKNLLWGNNQTYQFSKDVTASILVNASIHAIAEEASKMVIKSVRKTESENGVVFKENNDNINRLFSRRPNRLQTLKDMIYWSVHRLKTKHNFYWYPEKVIIKYADGTFKTEISQIFPIDSVSEEMRFDETTKKYKIAFMMASGTEYVIPYEDVIHVRENYGTKSYFFGSRSRDELLRSLGIIGEVKELLPKALRSSLEIKGALTARSQADAPAMKKFVEEFEKNMESSKKGIIATDVAGSFTPMNTDPKVIDKDTMSFISDDIIQEFGVDMSIIKGNATESAWSSFYQKNIEPIIIALEQSATSVLFTENEFNHGNRIKIYDKQVQRLSMTTRLEMIKQLGPNNYLSRAEQRELIGYEPDGGPEQVAMNQYVKQEDQTDYQTGKKIKKEEDEEDAETK